MKLPGVMQTEDYNYADSREFVPDVRQDVSAQHAEDIPQRTQSAYW
eukprot:CAMPEP_0119320320 /NCGR_PEP_ID=MMETSP1333-20130426/52132_1 /TAXON_ID=418940 /ORGANISM="Scyphosphaera apsteinii, Strain RCC1455" /LENGTH=45 /DNA_ID= /DNA_START= /DNA_END= /DNA_ORIENTATION=